MENRSISKYNDILRILISLETRQCIYLGIMGMARTITLLKYVANHKQFESLSNFEIFIVGAIRKILYNDLTIEKDIDNGIEICNSLIPILEEYDYKDCVNKQDEDIMGIVYSLVEEWFYFIGLLSLSMENEKCKQIGRFLSTPIILIDSYLCNKYDQAENNQILQEQVNNDEILNSEFRCIDSDILFVSNKENLKNLINLEKRMNTYIKHKFWK